MLSSRCGLVLLTLLAFACSEGGKDAAPTAETCPIASTPPSSDGGTLSCPRSIDSYCATAPECPPRAWSDVKSSLAQGSCWPGSVNECGQYDLLLSNRVGCGGSNLLFAYDKGTGQLIAAVDYLVPSVDAATAVQVCAAGPSSIQLLSACGNWTSCVVDAGVSD